MPKFIRIKNFEKYQHFKKSNPPWIKLYRSLFTDREFMQLPLAAKYTYIGLIMLMSEGSQCCPNDTAWISHRLSINPSEVDLKSLYRSGFLIASDSTIYRETRSKLYLREETETETETEKSRGEDKPPASASNFFKWVEGLKTNAAYSHINFEAELGKMDAWLSLPRNKGRQKTKRFVLNWLNKIEKPIPLTVMQPVRKLVL